MWRSLVRQCTQAFVYVAVFLLRYCFRRLSGRLRVLPPLVNRNIWLFATSCTVNVAWIGLAGLQTTERNYSLTALVRVGPMLVQT